MNGGLVPGIEDLIPVVVEETPQSALRYRFGGKDIAGQKVGASAVLVAPAGTPAAAAGRPYLDFGARLYDPRTVAWLSQDPMSEKYYPISPYAYCAGNPVNYIDPNGQDWYRIRGEHGLWTYYYDDDIFDEESMIAKGIEGEYLGKTYFDSEQNTYYILFGERMPYYQQESLPFYASWMYEHVDNLIIKYYTHDPDGSTPYESFYWGNLSKHAYGKSHPFEYRGYFEGNSFSSSPGTFFTRVNQEEFARAKVKETPHYISKTITDKFGYMKYEGFFLIFDNGYGSEIVRIYFANKKDAENYIHAVNKQFIH
ncbi:MAG: hypothetical protein IJ578_08105 [Bacteroidales bacterium]|nr:hypothetical protein [Bacteroidales bacterium]